MVLNEAQHGSTAEAEDRQAANFRSAREARHAEVAEDYVELIADLIEEAGEARAVDIARRLGVSQATVVSTVSRLRRDGLVRMRPYRSIFLTEQGRALADSSRHRHAVVLAFLRVLGVSEAAAQRDAEGLEHHVGPETLAAFERVIRTGNRNRISRKPRRAAVRDS